MNINTADFNLLKVFNALYQERNVSKAGERIGLAQSSMSNALSRLREQFDDPLFQRTPQGMLPTHRAEELAPMIKQTIEMVSVMINPVQFDPLTIHRQITIAAADFNVMALAPKLMTQLGKTAPNLNIHFVPLDKQQIFEQLDNEDVDIAIGTFYKLPARYHQKSLSTESFICLAKKNHPDITSALTIDTFTQLHHVLMTLKADHTGAIDNALAKMGKSRHIAMTCAQFSPLIEVVANSHLIATVPASLKRQAVQAGCDIYPVPVPIETWETELVVPQKFLSSELGTFMVKQLQRVQAQLN